MRAERPNYARLEFFIDELRSRLASELVSLLSGDRAAMAQIGLERIAMALLDLFDGKTPEYFAARARDLLGRFGSSHVYLPMLELIGELREREVTVAIVTGRGTEFVRAINHDLDGVPPELVVGTLIDYGHARDAGGAPAIW